MLYIFNFNSFNVIFIMFNSTCISKSSPRPIRRLFNTVFKMTTIIMIMQRARESVSK